MGKLLQDIKQWEGCHSAFLFGQDIHITLREGFNKQNELHQYLENQGHQNITIQPIEAGIEDCFMEQMISQENA